MKQEILRKIISLVQQAQDLAFKIGVPNVLQPGLVKEMIIADILGHENIFSKRDADACNPNDKTIKYEYLSCYEGGSGQLDRSTNDISHVGFTENWAKDNGKIVYKDNS
jgi:hypothetical protein